MRGTFILVLAGVIGSLVAGPANAANEQGWFTFAKIKIGGFDLQARTGWIARNGPPFVGEVGCFGDNQDVEFAVDYSSGIEFIASQFLAGTDEDGDGVQGASLRDVLWLHIDGTRYEYRNIAAPDAQFANYPYPPADPAGEIILVWRGTQSVRQNDTEPFRPLSSLHEQIANAKKFEWSMKDADMEVGERERKIDPKRRYPIDIAGLRQSVEWCRRQVASPAARTLPADVLKELTGREVK